MIPSAGDVLLARFPFTDLSSDKRRPVVVLSINNTGDDLIVCAITSRPQHNGPYDIPIAPGSGTGLKVPSRIQFDKIATLAKSVITGRLGALPEAFMAQHKPLLLTLLGLDRPA